jgi:zinc protease
MARVPSANQNYKTSLSLEVMAQILGGGSTSRLYKSLVIDQKLATSAGMGYSAEALDETDLYFYAVPKEGMSPQIVKNAIQTEIQKLIDNGVTDEERIDAITRMQDSAIYARDSLSGPAMIIGRALSSGVSLDKVETWPVQLDAVSKDDIMNVAKKFLDKESDHAFIISGYLRPKTQATATNDNSQIGTAQTNAKSAEIIK